MRSRSRAVIPWFPLAALLCMAPHAAAQAPDVAAAAPAPQAAPAETEEEAARRRQATFPAQQRPPGNPEAIARGEALYGIHCRSCHGQDLRGGDLGGPNLLRSQLVLNDQAGELIVPVVREGRNTPGMIEMPPLPLPVTDIEAVAEYLHSVVASARGQGAPPAGPEIELNILVGDAEAGREYFEAVCGGCHSATGDLQGVATRAGTPERLQDAWVAGRSLGGPGGSADAALRQAIATVTLTSGEVVTGALKRLDDFFVSLTTADGRHRSFSRPAGGAGVVADVDVRDPMARHQELLTEYTDAAMHDVTAYLWTLE